MDKQSIISGLNDLLTRNYDAEKGYSDAGNSVVDPPLREWLFANARMRNKFIDQLLATIKTYDGTPDPGSSFIGSLHRTWLDFKSDITDDNIPVVLEECERGEERSLEDYEKVIEETDFPADTETMLRMQYKSIEDSLDSLKSLISSYKQS